MNLFEVVSGKLSRMSYVNRYSSFPVNRRENVAEHSWWVTFIAYLITYDLVGQGFVIDVRKVLEGAMLHDISEVMSGDVIRSYKHSDPAITAAMKHADFINTEQLLGGEEYVPVGRLALHEWDSAKNTSRLEGQIVSFADMAAVAFYCREEDRSGNRAIRAVLREAYETWFHEFHDHPQLGQYIEQMFPGKRFSDMLRETELPTTVLFGKPMMQDHCEGETAAYDSAGWPTREVPLG